MTRIRVFLSVLLTLVLAGCAASFEVVQIPQHEADLYPLSQAKDGITVAIDEIKNAKRTERYFGADLIKAGILPVNVVVANYGQHRVVVKPSDILLHRGKEIIDPLPVEIVVAAAKRQHRSLRSKTEKQIDSFFDNLVFKETILLPNESYQGVMFFATPRPEKTADRFFTVLSMFREGGPKIRVGATDLDTGDRRHFGPFSLSLPENEDLFSYTSY